MGAVGRLERSRNQTEVKAQRRKGLLIEVEHDLVAVWLRSYCRERGRRQLVLGYGGEFWTVHPGATGPFVGAGAAESRTSGAASSAGTKSGTEQHDTIFTSSVI